MVVLCRGNYIMEVSNRRSLVWFARLTKIAPLCIVFLLEGAIEVSLCLPGGNVGENLV